MIFFLCTKLFFNIHVDHVDTLRNFILPILWIYKSCDCGECGTESPTSVVAANGNAAENSC
jgi:hypothetical protein